MTDTPAFYSFGNNISSKKQAKHHAIPATANTMYVYAGIKNHSGINVSSII